MARRNIRVSHLLRLEWRLAALGSVYGGTDALWGWKLEHILSHPAQRAKPVAPGRRFGWRVCAHQSTQSNVGLRRATVDSHGLRRGLLQRPAERVHLLRRLDAREFLSELAPARLA